MGSAPVETCPTSPGITVGLEMHVTLENVSRHVVSLGDTMEYSISRCVMYILIAGFESFEKDLPTPRSGVAGLVLDFLRYTWWMAVF